MDILNEWLKSTILRELSDGLRWLESSSANSSTNISHFEDDGNTLRAKVSKPGVVQMTKLVTFEEPIEAWVSDSITRLPVVFAASAVHRYRHETRRRLTQDPLGGLIQIKDFEIVATHLGPRPSRLTILIKDFQSLGSVGSGGFGLPRPVHALPEVIELLDRLRMLRSEGPCKARQDFIRREDAVDHDSPLGTQSEIIRSSPSDRSRSASQENFATQVSHSRLVESSGLHARKSNGTSLHENSNDSPAWPLSSRHIMRKPPNSPTKTLEKYPSIPNTNAIANANANAAKSAFHLPPPDFPSKQIIGKVNNRAAELLELLSRNQAPKLSKRSKTDAPLVEPGDNDRGSATQNACLKMDDQGEKAQTLPTRHEISSEVQASSARSTIDVNPCIEMDLERNGEAEVLNSAKPLLDVGLVSSPGSLRIRCREVKISRDQQGLLDCSSSWIPAEPGQRQPVGNIPIAILQSISDQVESYSRYSPVLDRSVTQPLGRAEFTTSASGLTSESESCRDSEREILISPGQWPPSSPPQQIREQLPPDSSMEAPLQANQVEKELGQEFSVRKRQKLSKSPASFVSAITDSENLTSTLRRSKKAIRSSPALSPTPSRQDCRTSKSSGKEAQKITRGRRPLAKYGHDKSDTHSTTSSAHTPISIASEESTPAWQTCVRCHVQFYSPGILSRHQKFCLKEPHEFNLNSSNSSYSPTVQKPENMLALSQETAHGTPNDQYISEARRNQLKQSTIPDHTEVKDHSSQEEMMNKSLTLREVSSSMISPDNTNVVIRHPEDIGDSHSSRIESANEQLSNNPTKNIDGNDFQQKTYPSTAIGPDEPVLQVKATPYVNGHLFDSASIDLSPLLSPSRKKNSLLSDLAHAGKPNEMPISPTVFEISSAQISSSKTMEDLLSDFNSSDMSRKTPTSIDLGPGDLHVREVAEHQNSDIGYHSPMEPNDITHVEETFISATAPLETSSGDYIADTEKTKRKFLELQPLSLDAAKRQKHVEWSTFNLSPDTQTMVDPSLLGSKLWQDFCNSTTSSIASIANEAPKSPTADPRTVTPDSYTKSISNEGSPEGKGNMNASLSFTSRKQTPVPDPENGDVSEAIAPSEEEEKLEKAVLEDRHLAAKTGRPSNTTLEMAEGQITDHMWVRDAEHNLHTTHMDYPMALDVFDQFKATYHDYTATPQQFVAICRKIERLVKDGHMEHQYLWDDFIIRHKTEYWTYLCSCAEKAEDALPYEQFYRKNIVKPLFTNGVVKPENLNLVFLPSRQIVNTGAQQDQQRENILGVENVVRRKVMKGSTSPLKASDGAQKPKSPKVTVDLTSDDEVSTPAQRQILMDPSGRESSRSLPWATNKSQVENTPTRNAVSRTSSSSNISDSPLCSAPPSSFMPPKAPSRVSSSPKKVAFSNDKESVFFTRAETTMYDSETVVPEQRKDSRENCSSTPQDDQVSPKPFLPLHESSRGKAQCESQQEARGKDENTPFASFARAYAAIRNGNGNSYARDREIGNNDNGTMSGKVGKSPKLKQIDVLSWRL